jgi:hypothetical protein
MQTPPKNISVALSMDISKIQKIKLLNLYTWREIWRANYMGDNKM